MKHYHQLTREQRYGIYSLLKIEHNQSTIAMIIGVHKSTVSREVHRNRGGRGYRCKQAHGLALSRRQGKSHPRIDARTWDFIKELIRQEWSPEQISGWMKKEMGDSVSHMNGSTNMLFRINRPVETCIRIYDVSASVRNGMVPMTDEDK